MQLVRVCVCVCLCSTQDWVCFGGGGRQLPTPPGAVDDESTYESCSSCSLSLFSEEFSGNLRDPGGVCVCAFVFRERVTVEFGLCCFVSVQRWYFQTSKELP